MQTAAETKLMVGMTGMGMKKTGGDETRLNTITNARSQTKQNTKGLACHHCCYPILSCPVDFVDQKRLLNKTK